MILSIDQGTTNSKAVLVDEAGQVAGYGAAPVGLASPRPGWVEQDADEIWTSVLAAVAACRASAPDAALAGVTISNQRESVVAWRRSTGEPLGPVIGWQDRRTASWCTRLATQDADDQVRARTGLRIDAMFSGAEDALAARPSAGRPDVRRLPGHGRRLAGLAADRRSQLRRARRATPRAPCCTTCWTWTGRLSCATSSACRSRPFPRCSRRTGSSDRPATCPDCPTACRSSRCWPTRTRPSTARACTTVGTAKATYGTGSSVMTPTADLPGRPHRGAVHAGLADRPAHLRPGGQHPLLRGRALLDGRDPRALRRRRAHGPGRRGPRQRRRGPGPRVRRPRRSLLGPGGPGEPVGDDDLDHAGASGPGRPGLGGPPDLRRRRGDRRRTSRSRSSGPTAGRRRRRC